MRDEVPPGRRSIDKYHITGEVKSGGFGYPECLTYILQVY